MKANGEKAPLPNDCEEKYDWQLKTVVGQAESQALVRLIAQVLDASGSGNDCSLRISATKSRDAYCITLYQDGVAAYSSAVSWEELLQRVNALL